MLAANSVLLPVIAPPTDQSKHQAANQRAAWDVLITSLVHVRVLLLPSSCGCAGAAVRPASSPAGQGRPEVWASATAGFWDTWTGRCPWRPARSGPSTETETSCDRSSGCCWPRSWCQVQVQVKSGLEKSRLDLRVFVVIQMLDEDQKWRKTNSSSHAAPEGTTLMWRSGNSPWAGGLTDWLHSFSWSLMDDQYFSSHQPL